MLAGVPEGSQFVAASRSTQPHVPRSRASGDVLRDRGGAAGTRRRGCAADLPRGTRARHRRAAGDGDGAHGGLAGRPAPRGPHRARQRGRRDGHRRRGPVSSPTTSTASRSPRCRSDTRTFLRRTAVLEHLTDDLCRAVAGRRGRRRPARARELERLPHPQDRTRAWYRYHPLYREFLLGELRREEPEIVPRAARARRRTGIEARQLPAMAIDHLLQTPDRSRAAALIGAVGLTTYQSGGMVTLQRWLRRARRRGDPRAPADAGPHRMDRRALRGRGRGGEVGGRCSSTASFTGEPGDGSASFALRSGDAARGDVRRAGRSRCWRMPSSPLAAEPSWSPWRDVALYARGGCAAAARRCRQGSRALHRGRHPARRTAATPAPGCSATPSSR